MTSETRLIPALAAGALACALALGACADFSRGEPSPKMDAGGPTEGGAEGGGDGGTALSFATDVYPPVLMFVDTSAPAGSRLLAKMTGNGHQGGTVYASGSPEYETVLHWIQQGAPQ